MRFPDYAIGNECPVLIPRRGLKQSLVDLNAFSTSTTRRLDETYYAVLEKMSGLQNTVIALKELAETSRDIYGSFDKDSQGLENDIVTQLGAVGQFDEQQSTIESLQTRITTGREKIQSLSQRVDTVRERIEGWERGDKAWQETTRRRLRLVWTVMVAVTLALILLFLGVTYRAENTDFAPGVGEMAASLMGSTNGSGHAQPPHEHDDGTDRTLVWRTPVDDGERLRAFDEL